MSVPQSSSFWTEGKDEHQQIAKTFYENIEYEHPGTVDSRGMCGCLEYGSYCEWAATSVKYYKYTGPSVQNIE